MPDPITVRFRMAEHCDDLIPQKAHADDAAFDLRSRIDVVAPPFKVTPIPTGLFLELPPHTEAQIRPRSGLALKSAITLLNSPGTIDAGYRGEIVVILFNASDAPFTLSRGDRIAQMVINRLPEIHLCHAESLSDTVRGDGGFGSSGTR